MNETLVNERFEAITTQLDQMAQKRYSSNSGKVDLDDLKQEAYLCGWHCCQTYIDKPEVDFMKLTMKSVAHALALYCVKNNTGTVGFEFDSEDENSACWEIPSNLNTEESLCILESIENTKEFFQDDETTTRVIEELLQPSEESYKLAKKSTKSDLTPKILSKVLTIPEEDAKLAVQKARIVLELYQNNSFSTKVYTKLLEENHMEVEEANWNNTSTFNMITVAKGLGLQFKESENDTIARMWVIKALNDRGILPSNKLFKLLENRKRK